MSFTGAIPPKSTPYVQTPCLSHGAVTRTQFSSERGPEMQLAQRSTTQKKQRNIDLKKVKQGNPNECK